MFRKKILVISIMFSLLVLSSCGLGKDEVLDSDYSISLKKALDLYYKTTDNKELLEVKFDIPENEDEYGYIFKNESQEIFINASNGTTTELSSKVSNSAERAFPSEKIENIKDIKPVLNAAKKEVGGISPRILSWKISMNNNNILEYGIDVKTTTSDKQIKVNVTD